MRKLLFLIFIISIFSCSKDEIENTSVLPKPLIENFSYFFMLGPSAVLHSTTSNLVTLEYDSNNLLLARNGGYSNLSPSSGFNYFFDNEVQFTFTYLDEEIIIERNPSHTSPLNKKTTFLLEDDKIVQKIVENPNTIMTFYEYNSIEKISNSITTINTWNYMESHYYYSTMKNLDSVITRTYQSNVPIKKVVEVFSEYDNVQNPLKNMMFFEDTFYRSLSENNYSKYEYFIYNTYYDDESLAGQGYKNWSLVYDESGNINFSPE